MKCLLRLFAATGLAVGLSLLTSSSVEAAWPRSGVNNGMHNGMHNGFNNGFNNGTGFFFPGYFPFIPGYGGYPGGGYPGGGYGGYPGGGMSSYPSYGGYSVSPTVTSHSMPLVFFTPTVTSTSVAAVKADGTTQQAAYYSPPKESIATLEVRVPADATVWVGGTMTDQTGEDRVFESPPLIEGKTYAYEVKAQWMKDGKPVEKTESLQIRAGERKIANFVVK